MGRDYNRGGRGREGQGYRGGRGNGRFQGRRNWTVKEYIVQVIQKAYKNGQDTAVSIQDLNKKDLTPLQPTRGVAVTADTAETLQLQKGMDIVYQAKLERYLDRKDSLEQNLTKAYALIFSNFCNKTMQNCIEEHPDYETMIRDDPIELLDKIKMLMHDPIRAKYPHASLTEAMSRMLNIKQIESEGLLDYVKRFKESYWTSSSKTQESIKTRLTNFCNKI
jgi:hypothetical protein